MLTRRQRERLDTLVQDPNFRVVQRGDTYYASAPGHASRRIQFRGDRTAIGEYLQNTRGVDIPLDRVNPSIRTEFRGNSEYSITQQGRRVKLRNARGELTERGKQVYQAPEITVEVPAVQRGRNSKGDIFAVETTKVFTEAEHPEIGRVFALLLAMTDEHLQPSEII